MSGAKTAKSACADSHRAQPRGFDDRTAHPLTSPALPSPPWRACRTSGALERAGPERARLGTNLLSAYYVPASGTPFQHYCRLQSEEAIRYAGEIVAFVRAQMA